MAFSSGRSSLLTSDTASAFAAGAAGAADPVDVVLGDFRQLVVHDVRQLVDVEPARGDVGRDEHAHRPCLEVRERARARALALVAVDRGRREAVAARAARRGGSRRASCA